MSGAGAPVRAAAARTIDAVVASRRSLRAALAAELPTLTDARDRALLEAIAFETLRRLRRYESLRDALLDRRMPSSLRPLPSLLLAGFAQLDGLGMPDYAVIAATAEAARVLRRPRGVGLVNAVLRRFVRERDVRVAAADRAAAIHRDHPDWLRERLRADWGADADAILDAGNAPAPMWLRVNLTRGSRDDYRVRLDAAGIAHDAPAHPASAIVLAQTMAPTALPGWQDGLVSVQDGAAQLTASLLDARTGERVLDACAAPGGKAAHLLESVPGVDLLAVDSDADRLARVRDTLARLHVFARVSVGDAAQPDTWWDGVAFDRILLDVPCSGTGVIRRHPDIKWHRRADDIAAMAAQQARLLDALWPLLRPGGRLVYATCSVLKDENERQIDAFLARHGDARSVGIALPAGRPAGRGWQILPGESGMDGFFHAVVDRSG